jgi:two-component system KDP operon response regulator KdpE
MSRAGRAITYGKLLAAVWGGDAREEIEYLRTYVNQLRKKIEDDPSKPIYLLTDVYVGYRFASADMFVPEDQPASDAGSNEMETQTSEGMR